MIDMKQVQEDEHENATTKHSNKGNKEMKLIKNKRIDVENGNKIIKNLQEKVNQLAT